MSWVTQVWSVAAGVCFGLAGLHLMVWLRSRDSTASLLFSVAASAAGAAALVEIALIRAETAAEYGEVLRWMHVPAAVVLISVVWFIRLHLCAGRLWLAWIVSGVRGLVVIVNFLTSSPNATFLEITSLRHVQWLGEVFAIPVGEQSPWRMLTHASTALFVIYVVDAGITAWRRDALGRAVMLCAAILVAIALAVVFSHLMVQQVMPGPFTGLIFLVIVLAMSAEVSIDLIRARQTASDLRRSEARVRLAAKAADLGLWEWDISRDRLWANGTGLAQAGIASVEGFSLERVLETVHADDRDAVRAAIRRLLEDGETVDVEYRVFGSDGGVRWIAARADAERGPDGRPLHVRGVTVDITSQKRKDAELQQQRDQLAHVQRVAALGQLSSAIGHEISQPLGAILRNAEAGELFLKKVPPDLDELNAIFADIQRDDHRVAAIIEQMRSFLKPRESALETLEVEELLEQVAAFLRAEFRAHETTLVLDLPRVLPAVRGDRIQLQQVVVNLLLNCLEALREFPSERREVVIRASSTARLVEVAVIDTGPGFAADQMASAFEPFMSTKKTGTGIGLAICKSIVESHGGHIWAENNPGGGAILRFTLPELQGGVAT